MTFLSNIIFVCCLFNIHYLFIFADFKHLIMPQGKKQTKTPPSKKSLLLSDKTLEFYKNPLTQTFGLTLRKKRLEIHPENPNEVAIALGVQPSYYRAVEAGTYNLHISNSLKLFEAFEGKFSYEAIQKILSTIAIIDAGCKETPHINYYQKFNKLFEKVGKHDKRIGELFKKFSVNKFLTSLEGLSHDEISQSILNNSLDLVMEKFLTEYKSFGKSPLQIQRSYPNTFFKNFPTDKIEFLEKLKDFVIETLPSKYDFRMSWEWERKNRFLFKNHYILDKNPDIHTGLKNFSEYQYLHLWEKNFENVFIIFISNQTSAKLKHEFRINLRDALVKSNATELLKTFDLVINKVEIKCASSAEEIMLAENILNSNNSGPAYNAAWVLSLTNLLNVGVKAVINHSDSRLTDGQYLEFEETLNILTKFTELWQRIPDTK